MARCILLVTKATEWSLGVLDGKIDREGLKSMTDAEISKLAANVVKLHRRCGHPSNAALLKALAARGADGRTLAIAEKMHCDECQEGRLKEGDRVTSLDREDQLWRSLQMDAFFFKHGNTVYHFLLLLDEASSFSVVVPMLEHSDEVSANIDIPAVLEALQGSWIQYFGYPQRLRCDLEGAFRGLLLADFCDTYGIELISVPAEHHQAIGEVERGIGELRRKMELFL